MPTSFMRSYAQRAHQAGEVLDAGTGLRRREEHVGDTDLAHLLQTGADVCQWTGNDQLTHQVCRDGAFRGGDVATAAEVAEAASLREDLVRAHRGADVDRKSGVEGR